MEATDMRLTPISASRRDLFENSINISFGIYMEWKIMNFHDFQKVHISRDSHIHTKIKTQRSYRRETNIHASRRDLSENDANK